MVKIKLQLGLLIILLSNIFVVAEDPSDEFDIMYVYTTAAKNRLGGTNGINNFIDNVVSKVNQSFINSDMDIQLNLVHTSEVNYPLDSYNLTNEDIYRQTLSSLEDTNDGYMDNIHTLRNRYSADIVYIIIENNAYAGLANVMNYAHNSFNNSAFGAVSVNLNGGIGYSTAAAVHELGHTMGINHEIEHAGDTGATYPYAAGYRQRDSDYLDFRTIMGNGISIDNLIYNWSSPDIYYRGLATGTSDKANARQAILNNASIISNFRQRPVTTPPTLTTIPPSETLKNNVTIEINGEVGYGVYINGIYKGVVSSNGKKALTLNLPSELNNFTITLKHEPSGTVSDTLSFNIIKKNPASIIVTTIIVPYILNGN